ncbi:ABC transporter permease subunit [Thermoclostridium stercorarium]|uniref:ABC transporter permease subunit n=1 Tax=Thermoclostridium stercorarium TaxID=1510 RepID=UPI000AFFD32C
MGNFGRKLEKFWEIFYENGGYTKVLTGLKNTLYIAVAGLAIGIIIGTIIAIIEVFPKYKKLPRILDTICRFYVGLFRGSPIVVQLLVAYYVVLPLVKINIPPLNVCVIVFGLNSGAYVSEIMRSGIMSVDPGRWKQVAPWG